MNIIPNSTWDNKIAKPTKKEREHIIKNLIVAIDTREQQPLEFKFNDYELQTVRATLKFGDYTLFYPNQKDYICIERKSLQDFIQSCTHERERFEKELIAMRGYEIKFILCEFDLNQLIQYLENNNKSNLINPLINSAIRFYEYYNIPCIFCGSRKLSARYVAETLIFRAKTIAYYARSAYEISAIDTSKETKMS